MKKLVKNITSPIRIAEDISIEVEESLHDQISWTAEMPKGDLTKLKKVCKPIAVKNGLTFWVLDSDKVDFISE